jgi:hypothetical protein
MPRAGDRSPVAMSICSISALAEMQNADCRGTPDLPHLAFRLHFAFATAARSITIDRVTPETHRYE